MKNFNRVPDYQTNMLIYQLLNVYYLRVFESPTNVKLTRTPFPSEQELSMVLLFFLNNGYEIQSHNFLIQ